MVSIRLFATLKSLNLHGEGLAYMRVFYAIVFLFITLTGTYAQRFLHMTSNDGLPDNHARFVFQDEGGYIYVGTRSGLSRYDGYNFLISTMEDSISSAPKEFSAMIETSSGFFTVASSGIYEYNMHSNQLKLSKKLQLLDEACFIEFENNIFCGTSAGLYQYDRAGKQWKNYNQYVSGIDNIHVRAMIISEKEELLLGTSKGFFRFDKHMKLLESDIGNDSYFHDINGIIKDGEGGYWFSTFTNLYYRNSDFEIVRNYNSFFADKHIRCIELDHEKRVWVGGEFGIVIFDPKTESAQELFRDVSLNQGLNDNAIYSIFRDKADNMWVGTYFGGINIWNSSFDKFAIYFPGNSDDNLSGKVVREMQEDKFGNLWLALEDGGLNYLNLKTGAVKRFFFEKENEYKNVHSLILDGDKLWVGSFNEGLECYHITFIGEEPGLARVESYLVNKMIFAISGSSDEKIYVGAVDGIYILDLKTRDIYAYKEEIFANRMVYTLKCVSDNELLAGTLRNGLYYCDLENDVITNFSREDEFYEMQNISSITDIGKQRFAITCTSGLYMFSCDNKSLDCILTSKGITEFRSVLIDDAGSYWVSTTNGLSCFTEDGELLKKYNMYDGLPENQFNFNSAFKTSDNQMFFGTYNGLISFDPVKLKNYVHRIPEVLFTSYTVVGDDKTTLHTLYMDNKQDILRLKSYQTFLSLEFSTLAYTQSRDLNYEIRISGKKGNWDQMLSNRLVTFSNLSKGWHKVEVRPVSDGLIYGPPSVINIYRKPAVWQTAYAYVFYAILVMLIFLYARREFLRRQNEKNFLSLERYEKDNQKVLNDQKMRFFLNISHEFRTPLTIIGGTISNILTKFSVDKDVEDKLQTIQNNSDNLSKLVNDFMDYGKLESGFKPLEVKKQPILQFAANTCSMFDNWAEANQLSYTKKIIQSDILGYFDPEKLERVIYNLLSNAFKFNKSNGSVYVEVSVDEKDRTTCVLLVKDTGPGIHGELLNEIQKHFNNDEGANLSEKSIGLAYTAGMVKQMGGTIELESELGLGSIFKVEFPIDKPGKEQILHGINLQAEGAYDNIIHRESVAKTMIKEENRPHILIIDDNEDLLTMLKDSLDSEYNTIITSSPKQALSMVVQQELSLIICDIMMPEMNGFEVIESLQANILTSHIPIIILTAAAEKNIELKGYMKGAVSYLAKPFKHEELVLKIESILSFRRELIRRFSDEYDIRYDEVVCSEKDEKFLSRAVNVVHEHLDEVKFDVDMFCSNMNVSRTLLHTKLKSITGLSTTEFMRSIRLKQAYIMLKKGSMSVSEVAIKCGFNDAGYFSKCFKKKYDIFPSKLKK